jgi:hypothetical protein
MKCWPLQAEQEAMRTPFSSQPQNNRAHPQRVQPRAHAGRDRWRRRFRRAKPEPNKKKPREYNFFGDIGVMKKRIPEALRKASE